MANSIEVPVVLALNQAQEQIAQLRKALQEGLDPKSTEFKTIIGMIEKAANGAEHLKATMQSSFSTSSGAKKFSNEMQRTFDLINTIIGRMKNVDTKNLLFSEEDQEKIKNIHTEIEKTEKTLAELRAGKIGTFFEGNVKEEFKDLGDLAKTLFSNLQKMSFTQLGEGLEKESKKVQESLDKIQEKIKSITSAQGKVSGNTNSDPFSILKTTTLTTVTPKVNRLIIDNLKNSLKQTFQEYNELFDIKSLTANLNKVTQKDVQQGAALTLQTQAIEAAVEEAINKLKTEKNKYQQALEELSNVQTSGFGRDANGRKVSSRAAQAARENAANQARDIVQKLGIETPEREDFEFVSKYVERLRTKVEEESTKFIQESEENLKQKGEQLKSTVSGVFKSAFSEFEINDSKGFQARVKEWLMGDLKLTELGPELTNAISQMTKGTNVDEAFSILGNALKNSLSNSLAQLGSEETAAQAKAEALTNAMKTLGLVAQDNDGKIKLNEKSLEDLKKTLEGLLGQKLGDFTNMIPVPDPKQTYEAENALTQYINRLKELETRQKSLSNVQTAVKQWMGFYQVLNLGKKAITDMKNHIQELDSVMTQIAVVTNMSQSDLWNQIGQYSQIARQYGVAIKGVYEVSQIYYQQGLEQNDVMTLTTETLKMARIAGLDYATAADYMTTAIRGFKLEMSDASHVTDVYSALAATTASSTEELAVAISKTASSAEAVGASFEATSAMMATMIATTRESATNIGTALKSVISRYGEMTSDPSKLVDSEGEEMSLNRVDKALQTIGITIHDVNGQFRDFDDVILELGKKWNTIDKNAQRYIATLMAGNRQQSRFLALVSNIDEYEKALVTAQNAEGTGEVQTLKTLDSIDARLEKMKVTIQEFYTSSGLEDLYKGVLDIITNIFDAANHLPKLFDKIPVTALAVGGTIINVIKNVLSLIVAEISAAMDTAKNNIDLTITKRIAQAKEDGRQIGRARKKGEIEGEQEVTTGTSVKTGIGKQLGSIAARTGGAILSAAGAGLTISGLNQYGSSLTKEQDRSAGVSTLFGGILGIGGNALTGLATGGPVGAAIGAVTGLISNIGTLTSAFSMLNVSTARQIELADKRLEKAKQEEAVSKNEVKNLETAYNKLIELEKHRYDSTEDAKAYAEYMNQLGDTYPKFIESLSTSGDVIISVTAMEEELGRVRATALENTIKTVKSEKEALELRQETNKKFLEQIEDFSFSENSEKSLKDFMYKLDSRGMYNEDRLFSWIEQYFNDEDYKVTKTPSINNFIEKYSGDKLTENLTEDVIDQFYKDAWEVLQIEGNTSLEDFKGYLSNREIPILSHVRSQIIEAINSYISIPENKDFLKQFEGLEDAENPISVIENWSIEDLLNLSNQIYTYINSVVNSTDEALKTLGTQINSAEGSAEIQKRINKLLENKGTEDSGKKLQSYFKLMTSLLGNKDAVDKQFEKLSDLILEDTATADKLMNLDYSQFSSADSIIDSLSKEWQEYGETIRKNFDVIRNSAVEGMKDQIEGLTNLDITKIISFKDNGTFDSKLITQLIPSLREGLSQYQKLLDKGLFSDARIYGEGLVSFFTSISSISDEAQLKISSIVREIDFSDSESLHSAAEKLKAIDFVNDGDKKAVQEAAENLEGAAKQYIINVSTLLMQLKETTTDTAKALETAFDNQTKALSRSEAMKAAQELLKGYTGSYSNLDWDKLYEYNSELGGYVANQIALEIAITKATGEAKNKLKDINDQITNQKKLIDYFGENNFKKQLENYSNADELSRAGWRTSWANKMTQDGLNGEQLVSLFDQMAQQAKGYDTVEDYLEEQATEGAKQVAEAQAEIEFATQEAAIDWLRKQKYEDIASGNYTQIEKSNIKTAFDQIFKDKAEQSEIDKGFEELWELLEKGQFEKFNEVFEILIKGFYGANTDLNASNIISTLLFPKGQEAELKQQQTALSEVLSKIPYEQMSQATKEIVGTNYNIESALEKAKEILAKIKTTSGGDTSKEYKEALAQIWEFTQSQDKAASLINQIRDGQISATEEVFSQIVDGNGNLIDKVKDFLEIDKENGTIKFQEGISLKEGAEKLANALGISLDELKLTDFYKNFLSDSIDQQIKDLDANDVSKQMLSQLQTLSSAKTGDRVRIDKLPAGIQEKLSSVIDDTYKVTSEFQLQAILTGLNANDFEGDIEAQRWLQQYKQEIENKKPIQQQALQNVIASSFSMDQARTFMSSLMPNIDISHYDNAQIQGMMKRHYGFDWDPFTQQFTTTIESINKINSIIQNYAEQGLATPEDINNLKAMLSQLEYQIGDGRKYSALSNIIENSEAVSDEMIAELKTAYSNLTDSDIENIFGITKQSNGTFKANVALLLKLIGGGFTDLANKASDAYINNIQSILSMASNGTTSIDEMSKFAETFGVDAKTAFIYDNDLGAWKLDASQLKPLIEKQAEELKKNSLLTDDEVDSWVKKQIDSITVDQIDIKGILSATTKTDQNKYKNILTDYYKTHAGSKQNVPPEVLEKWAKNQADYTFNVIRQGGQAAVDKIKEIKGDNITAEDIEAAYNYYSDSIISAMDLLEGDIIGKFVTDEQKLLLAGHGISIDDNNMITSVDNLVDAYESLYQAMKNNNEGTASKLNTAYARVLSAEEQGEAEVINVLSDAMGMTYETLGELFDKYASTLGVTLEEVANDSRWAEFGLERIGGQKVRINNFEALADKMGWDYGSEEYIDAYDTYVDALITARDKTRKSILDEAKAIAEASAGDTINLTQLSAKIKELDTEIQNKFINNLSMYGAEFSSEGILELQDNADIYHVLQTIYDIANKGELLLEDDLVELRDALDQVLKGFSDTLSKGIEGNLSQVELNDLLEKSSNLLHIDLSDADFTRTAEGFKISTDAAIKLYTQLEKIDHIQARLVFDKLSESLQSSNDHYKSTTNLLTHIKDLHEKITKLNGTKDLTKLQQYKEELAVAEKIAQVRATSEDSSFKFMDNNLEGGLNNPVNYGNAWGKAFVSMNKAAESGHMAIEDFMNIINEMGRLAELTGQTMSFMGHSINDVQDAAKLIELGFSSLTNVDGEGLQVSLAKIGGDFSGGAATMAKGVKGGIKAIAQSQIDMLDGMISLLETIVALENLDKIEDADNNGIFSIGDIFKTDKNNNPTEDFTEGYQVFAKQLIDNANKDEDLAKALDQVRVKNFTLRQLVDDATDGVKDLGISYEDYFAVLKALNEAAQSGDYSLENIGESLREVLAGTEFNGTIQAGNYTIAIGYGTSVIKNEDGDYVGADGKTYKNPDDALKASVLAHQENLQTVVEQDENGKKHTEHVMNVGGVQYKLKFTNEGIEYVYTDENGNEQSAGTSQADVIQHAYDAYRAKYANNPNGFAKIDNIEKFAVTAGYSLSVSPKNISIDEKEVENAGHKAKEDLKTKIQKYFSGDGSTSEEEVKEAAATVGIKINTSLENISEKDYQALLKAAGIEEKSIIMSISAKAPEGEGADILTELIEGEQPLKKEITVDIKKGTDETGMFNKEDDSTSTDSSLSKNVEFSINVTGNYSTILTQNADGTYTLLTSDAEPITINILAEIPAELTGDSTNGYTIKTCDGAMIKVPVGLGTITNLVGDAINGYTIKTQDGVIVKVPAELSTVTNLTGDSTNGYTIKTAEGAIITVPAELGTVTSLTGDAANGYTIKTKEGAIIKTSAELDAVTNLTGDATSGYTIKTKEGATISVPAELGTTTNLIGNAAEGYTVKTKEGATINIPAELGTTTNLIGDSTTGFTIFTTSGKVINVPAELGTPTGLIGDSINGYTIRTIAGAEIIVPASLGTPIGLIGDAINGYTIFTIDGQKIGVPVEAGTPVGLIGDSTNGYTIRTTTGAEINIPISNPLIPSELTGDSTTGYTVKTITADTISIPTSADMDGFYTDVDQAPTPTKIIHTITVNDVLNPESPASKDLNSMGIDPGAYFTVSTAMPELTQKINVQYELTGDSEEYARQVQEIYDFIVASENDEVIIDLQTKFSNSSGNEEDYQEYVNGITSRLKELWAQQHVEVEPLELPAEVNDGQLVKEVDEAVTTAQKAADGKEVEITTTSTENKKTKETKTISVDASGITSSGINDQLSTLSSNTQKATNKAKELTSSLEEIDTSEVDTTPFETMETSLEGALSAANQLFELAWDSLASVFPLFTPSASTSQSDSGSPEVSEPQTMTFKIDADPKLAEKKLEDTKKLIEETVAIMGINAEDRGASSTAAGIRNLINQMWGYINISAHDNNTLGIIGEIQRALNDLVNGGPYRVSVEATVTESGGGSAKGNVALSTGNAQARGTLMGELGPELVVSGGRYFVVGQNGAEMVDLDPDAIVFNHLQTKKLLSTGHAGRGIPITNERNATSLATGNIAMASAQEALNTLRQLRSLWQSILNASLSDLGQLAGRNTTTNTSGGNGGGSGGNGGNNGTYKIDAGFIADLERWYNLLREIASCEKEITYQEELRNKIQSERYNTQSALYESQKKTLDQLKQEVQYHQQLAVSQRDYYEQRRAALQDSPYSRIFTFDENGVMQYTPGEGYGLNALATLNATTAEGSAVYNAEQQFRLLQQWGFFKPGQPIYDSSGNQIDFGEDETDATAKWDKQQAGFAAAVQAFWDRVDSWKTEMDDLYDSISEQERKILENDIKRNEILKQIRENQLNVEDKVYQAIVDSREAEIDNAQKQRDALEKTSSDFINGLNDQLNKEQEMYRNQDAQDKLNTMRRQLDILKRSGGSASAISALEKQIKSQEQSMYFDSQQQQIDAIKEAQDAQIKKLDTQINLMRESLEYEKAHGLLWGQVLSIMQQSAEQINNFIATNTTEWAAYSPARIAEEMLNLSLLTENWEAFRDDTDNSIHEGVNGNSSYDWENFSNSMKELYGEDLWKLYSDGLKNIYNEIIEQYDDPVLALREVFASDAFQQLLEQNRNNERIALPAVATTSGPRPESTSTSTSSSSYSGGGSSGGGSYYSSGGSSSTSSDASTNTYKLTYIYRYHEEGNNTWTVITTEQSNVSAGTYYAGNHIKTFSNYKYESSNPASITLRSGNSQGIFYFNYVKKENASSTTSNDERDDSDLFVNHIDNNTSSVASSSVSSAANSNVTSTSSGQNNGDVTWRIRYKDKDGNVKQGMSQTQPYNQAITSIRTTLDRNVGPDKKYTEGYATITKSNGSIEYYPSTYANANRRFIKGGIINYTGPAWVDGSKTKPEYILNANATKMWKEDILSGKAGSLTYGVTKLQDIVNSLVLKTEGSSNTSLNNGVNIEKVELTMNATIANNYDAQQAGEQVLERIVQIARKTSATNIRR